MLKSKVKTSCMKLSSLLTQLLALLAMSMSAAHDGFSPAQSRSGVTSRRKLSPLSSPSLVMGSYLKEGDKLRVSIELVDVERDRIIWQNSVDLEYSQLSSVQDRVAGDVLRGLRLNLTEAETHDLRRYLPNPVAYEYDLRGIAISRKSDYLSAMKMYEKAVEADPNYALAWTHIAAVCYFFSNDKLTGAEYRRRADKAIDRALKK